MLFEDTLSFFLTRAVCEQGALLESVFSPDPNSSVESWQVALLSIHPLSRKILMLTEEKKYAF